MLFYACNNVVPDQMVLLPIKKKKVTPINLLIVCMVTLVILLLASSHQYDHYSAIVSMVLLARNQYHYSAIVSMVMDRTAFTTAMLYCLCQGSVYKCMLYCLTLLYDHERGDCVAASTCSWFMVIPVRTSYAKASSELCYYLRQGSTYQYDCWYEPESPDSSHGIQSVTVRKDDNYYC